MPLVAVAALWWGVRSDEIRHPPGILTPNTPKQVLLKKAESWRTGQYEITPLAEFDIDARVLSKARYYLGREVELSPVDLVLGWGRMSDQQVLDQVAISQSGRWFYWTCQRMPIDRAELTSHCANMHMLPATADVREKLLAVCRGNVVHIEGYLVAIQGPGQWTWRSSLARDDTGNGSCEVIWVKDIAVR
jgi:hypothetical protein